ncbi:MAG: permease-like cell division protein FtsX [Patescibacteria group bacterium]
MMSSLLRLVKYGWQHFWRNKWLSLATLFIIVLALIVFEMLIVFSVITKTGLEILKDKIDISVYFKVATPESEILKIKKSIEELSEVDKVEYVSKEKALEIFKEKHKNDPTIIQALEELEENPLSSLINIKAKDPTFYSIIAGKLDNNDWRPLIEKITYTQNKVVIERLGKIVDIGNKLGLILTILLSISAILVTFNTVSLAIYSAREEIGIMRLVGAPNYFITGPYIVEGIIYGLLAAIISMLIFWPVAYWASPYLKFLLSNLDLRVYLLENFFKLLGYQILFGVGLGVVSSNFAIRKYLKI